MNEGLNIAFVLPLAKCDMNFSPTEEELIMTAGFIGVVLASHMWGFLVDTWGRQKVLKTSLGTAFFWSAISSFSINPTMFVVTRFIAGLW